MDLLCVSLLLLLIETAQGSEGYWVVITNITVTVDKKDWKATPLSRNFTALFVVVPLLITSMFVMAIYMKKRSIISKGSAYSGAGG
ncbi:hypothetical protein AAFF_G00087320 [Aldrovandia affinis]|uniref:Uncharacterized protein n=1 Tax=Aldrovandia affinis TaxID=143900 RepID=A0AAD7RWB2_9TELE|nr:hypothetical protein AAFF_G00087320 [Aldrovandia affinis]